MAVFESLVEADPLHSSMVINAGADEDDEGDDPAPVPTSSSSMDAVWRSGKGKNRLCVYEIGRAHV